MGQVDIGVYSVLGNEIKQARLLKSTQNVVQEFDIGEFPHGLYWVKISFGEVVLVSKILKD